jgi:hypothetical protein
MIMGGGNRQTAAFRNDNRSRGAEHNPMLWFYRRDEELITIETRVDEATHEYVLIMQTADNQKTEERFKNLVAFKDRLLAAERRLAGERWTQAGPPVLLLDGWPRE